MWWLVAIGKARDILSASTQIGTLMYWKCFTFKNDELEVYVSNWIYEYNLYTTYDISTLIHYIANVGLINIIIAYKYYILKAYK